MRLVARAPLIKKLVLLQAPQYDTTAHVKTPKGAQAPTYSHLNRREGGGEKGSGEYQQLNHNKEEIDPAELEVSRPSGRYLEVSARLRQRGFGRT